jgi:hypothetical protein
MSNYGRKKFYNIWPEMVKCDARSKTQQGRPMRARKRFFCNNRDLGRCRALQTNGQTSITCFYFFIFSNGRSMRLVSGAMALGVLLFGAMTLGVLLFGAMTCIITTLRTTVLSKKIKKKILYILTTLALHNDTQHNDTKN